VNVIYSPWFNLTPWADTTLGLNGAVSRAIRNAPGVTQNIIDQGVVLSYANDGSGVYKLPWLFNFGGTLQLGFTLVPSKIIYFLSNPTTGTVTGTSFTGQVRYIIIPGGVAGGVIVTGPATGYSVDQLKAMSYHEVETLFKIPTSGTNFHQVKWANQE
jgi:hypothetical protein